MDKEREEGEERRLYAREFCSSFRLFFSHKLDLFSFPDLHSSLRTGLPCGYGRVVVTDLIADIISVCLCRKPRWDDDNIAELFVVLLASLPHNTEMDKNTQSITKSRLCTAIRKMYNFDAVYL